MIWLAFCLLFLRIPAAQTRIEAVLASYESCLSELSSERAFFDRFIPPWLGALDRRFHHMREGIRVMHENYRLLRGVALRDRQAPMTNHLINNAIEECQVFRSRYEDYARGWVWFLGLTGSTAAVFVAWMIARRVGVHTPMRSEKRRVS